MIGRGGFKLRGAGVDRLIGGHHAAGPAQLRHALAGGSGEVGDLDVGEARLFIATPLPGVEVLEVHLAQEFGFEFHELRELVHEPGVESRAACDVFYRRAATQHLMQREEALGRRHHAPVPQLVLGGVGELTVLAEGETDATLFE